MLNAEKELCIRILNSYELNIISIHLKKRRKLRRCLTRIRMNLRV
jgi:hypothetical protein